MKKILLIAMLLCTFCLFAQNPSQQQQQNSISTALPNLSPQTPTTANLGKYGEVQVNESTGTISPSIPLFDFYTGINNLPISLQYSGNAVRVTQDPTWVGINWNLNAGGVITRVVRDLADEKTPANNKMYKSKEDLNSLNGAGMVNDVLSNWYLTLQSIGGASLGGTSTVDSEVDLFNYNFMGYSGSFFLDENNIGHLVKYDKEISISLLYDNGGNKSIIIIKTPDGNTYTFGGDLASESSRSFVSGGGGSGATILNPFSQNAFYLTDAHYLNGGNVHFEYEAILSNNQQQVPIGIQESLRVMENGANNCMIANPSVIEKVIENSVCLKKITTNMTDQYILFDYEILNPLRYSITKLNNIYLKSNNSNSSTDYLKKVSLDFTFSTAEDTTEISNKFFLTAVNFYNSLNIFDNKYEMEYDQLDGIPKRSSFAQDLLGYYNGVNSNTTLLPENTELIITTNCPTLANRDAILNYSKYGSLAKIKYPTGGSSTFIYELPYGGYRTVFSPTLKNISVVYNIDGAFTPHTLAAGSTTNHYGNGEFIDYGDDTMRTDAANANTFEVTTNTTIPLTFTSNVSGTYSKELRLHLIIKNITTNVTEAPIEFQIVPHSSTPYLFNQDIIYTSSFNLTPGLYSYDFWVDANCADTHNCVTNNPSLYQSFRCRLTFSLPSYEEEVYLPGLRIKEVLTTTSSELNQNVPVQKTVYYYKKLGEVRVHSRKEYYQFNPSFIHVTRELPPEQPTGSYQNVFNLSANSVNNPFHNESGTYNYKYVTVSYGGSNFENGGKSLVFNTSSGQPAEKYACTVYHLYYLSSESNFDDDNYSRFIDIGENGSFQNSVLSEETLFDKNFYSLKKTNYEYSFDDNGFEMNNIKPYLYCNNLSQGTVYYLHKTKSYKYKQTVTTTTDFFNLNPVNDPDEVTSIVTKEYDTDKVSLPKSITTTSSQGISKQTNLYYPSDIVAIGNVSGTDAALLTQLQNNHNVAEVVKMESYANSILLDTKQVFYKNFGNKILPHIIQSKKGATIDPSVLEDRVVIEGYNSVGKPTIVKLANGTYTEYVYNGKQQVVLKIENAQYFGENDARIKPIDVIIDNPCKYQNELPKSMVTTYNYDPVTNNLTSIVDPKCDIIYYEYDDFNRLKLVRDRNGRILSENEYHYKP